MSGSGMKRPAATQRKLIFGSVSLAVLGRSAEITESPFQNPVLDFAVTLSQSSRTSVSTCPSAHASRVAHRVGDILAGGNVVAS